MAGIVYGVADGTGPLLLHDTPIGAMTTGGTTTAAVTTAGTTATTSSAAATTSKLSAVATTAKLSFSWALVGSVLVTGAVITAVGLVSYAVTKAAIEP